MTVNSKKRVNSGKVKGKRQITNHNVQITKDIDTKLKVQGKRGKVKGKF